jgi:hypothetical protein
MDEIYGLLLTAAAHRQPVAAIYDGFPRLLCPHVLGRNREGHFRALCYQFGGGSGSGLLGPEGVGGWRCIAVDKLSKVECYGRAIGVLSRGPAVSTVSSTSISTPILSPGTIRKKGSEAVAAATGAPVRCAASRSRSDYAARGERGDPRGRKSGAGPVAANAR